MHFGIAIALVARFAADSLVCHIGLCQVLVLPVRENFNRRRATTAHSPCRSGAGVVTVQGTLRSDRFEVETESK
jgi:hypothetical protein